MFTVWEIKRLAKVFNIYKGFVGCFEFVVKIRRDTFGSVEGASDAISFPFCGNFRLMDFEMAVISKAVSRKWSGFSSTVKTMSGW